MPNADQVAEFITKQTGGVWNAEKAIHNLQDSKMGGIDASKLVEETVGSLSPNVTDDLYKLAGQAPAMLAGANPAEVVQNLQLSSFGKAEKEQLNEALKYANPQ